jgi:WD40 repeat protein
MMNKDFGVAHGGWPVRNIKITNCGVSLFSVGGDNCMRQFSTLSGDLVYDFGVIHDEWVKGLAIIADDKWVVTGGGDGIIRQWAVKGKGNVQCFRNAHEGGVMAVCATPDGKYLFSGGADGALKQWTIGGGICVKNYGRVHEGCISSMLIQH